METLRISGQCQLAVPARRQLKSDVDRRTKRLNDLRNRDDTKADELIERRELKVPTRTSIAARGAEYIRGKGFTRCSYFGYLGPMESMYAMDVSSTKDQEVWHKFVNLEQRTSPGGA